MKRLLILFLLLTTGVCLQQAGAQDRVSSYAIRLGTAEPRTGARVEIHNDTEVATGLRVSPRSGHTVGYRICIFFDNTQNGRSLAYGALSTFRSHFPGIPGEVIYDSPTFKTLVGYCIDINEAAMLLGRVREYFPKAVMREENVSIAQLKQSPVITLSKESIDSIEDKDDNDDNE
ncbi:MAG: hypothetical protein K2G93_05715 [Rikenella sp.]|nr:hypothetical protein [Rikenella sp.]